MAGENGRIARYNRVLMEPIPEFISDIERLFVSVLKSLSKANNVEEKDVAYNIIYQLTKNMSRRMRKIYWDDAVLWKIMQLRNSFVAFRKFINQPMVAYNEATNRVVVGFDYFQILHNRRETAQHRIFRANGCPYYKNLKIIFVHRKFSLLNDEPRDLGWDNIPKRPGDDRVHHYLDWTNEGEDSDDDSDYDNEFDN